MIETSAWSYWGGAHPFITVSVLFGIVVVCLVLFTYWRDYRKLTRQE